MAGQILQLDFTPQPNPDELTTFIQLAKQDPQLLLPYATSFSSVTIQTAVEAIVNVLPAEEAVQQLQILLALPNRSFGDYAIYLRALAGLDYEQFAEKLLELLKTAIPEDDCSDLWQLVFDLKVKSIGQWFLFAYIKGDPAALLRDAELMRLADNPEISGFSFETIMEIHEEGAINDFHLAWIMTYINIYKPKSAISLARYAVKHINRPIIDTIARNTVATFLTEVDLAEAEELLAWMERRLDELIAIGQVNYAEFSEIGLLEKKLRKLGFVKRCEEFCVKIFKAMNTDRVLDFSEVRLPDDVES